MTKPTTVIITKSSLRRLDETVIRSQLSHIVIRMLSAGRASKWSCRHKLLEALPPTTVGYFYRAALTITRTGRAASDEALQSQVSRMLEIGQAAANSSNWFFPNRKEVLPFAETALPRSQSPARPSESTPEPVAVPPTAARSYEKLAPDLLLGSHFDHIYEREAQISVIYSALQAFVRSDYDHRFHCVLHGEPACGKTEIARSFTRMLGSDAVIEFDATSTTKAGAERIILESANLPPVLICEEIEKTDETSLRWLLGVLDHRGEIRKVTHGGGLRQRQVKMLCIATVNDMALFERVMDGALASRFSHKIWCPRPSKDVLTRILAREVAKVSGDTSWIAPAVDWCVDTEGTNDPRRVTTVCLSGREKLLTGEYQELLRKVLDPRDIERKKLMDAALEMKPKAKDDTLRLLK